MASQTVQMDYAVITSVSKNFQQASQALVKTGKALQLAIGVLVTSAFMGGVLNVALIQYLAVLLEKVNKLAALTGEFGTDLARAVQDHRSGQYSAGTYFGEGLK